jgi:cation diffusion facilitator family transporter
MAAGEHGTKAVVAAGLANLVIAAAKFTAFLFTGASSLLAESIHSVADTGNQALLLLGGRKAKRAADELHPFGYGRERYFWSFVVAIVLFLLGAVFAVYEGIHKIEHPEPLENPIWAYGVLGFAIVVEGLSFRTAVVEANKVRRRATWPRFIRNAKSPELPVVLLEDTGALAGLVIALAAVTTSEITGDPIWDGIGTLSIGVLLGIIAIVLVVEMKSLLIGESATRKDVESIRAAVEIDPAVKQLIHMRTQHQGPEELLVGMKVELDHDADVPRGQRGREPDRAHRAPGRPDGPDHVHRARRHRRPPGRPDHRRARPGPPGPPTRSGPSRRSRTSAAPLGVGIPLEDDL